MNNMRKLMEAAEQLSEMPVDKSDQAEAREELYNLIIVIEELMQRANLPQSAELKFMDFAEMIENIAQADSVGENEDWSDDSDEDDDWN